MFPAQSSGQTGTKFERFADDMAAGFQERRVEIDLMKHRSEVEQIGTTGGRASNSEVRSGRIRHGSVIRGDEFVERIS
jgi:hypothetical protein